MKKISIILLLLMVTGCSFNDSASKGNEYDENNAVLETTDKLVLETTKDEYSIDDLTIDLTITNNTSSEAQVLLIPKLLIKDGNSWENVSLKENVAFCGNSDSVISTRDASVKIDWFEELIPGDYKIAYKVTYLSGKADDSIYITTEFKLT